jgi:lysylphosphatidylglycerol synthetase-like protein (DUF2156 family)
VSLAASFLCFSLGGGFWASRHDVSLAQGPVLLVCGGLAVVAVAVLIAISGRRDASPVENRDPDDEAPVEEDFAHGGSAYRSHARRVLLAASPRLSGRATAMVILTSLAGAAVLLPASVKLPRWVEAELVLGAWWLIVAVALTTLLYRGFRLRDDLVYFAPWDRPKGSSPGDGKAAGSPGGCGDLGGCGNAFPNLDIGDGEGCLVAIAVGLAMVVAFGAAWVFVELVMPLIFFLMYALFMRAIARAARDRRGCEGDLVKSLGFGGLWATIYVVPIAALTWLFHALHRHGSP